MAVVMSPAVSPLAGCRRRVDVADIARHVGHSDTSTTAEYVKRLGNRPVDTARRAAELLDPTID